MNDTILVLSDLDKIRQRPGMYIGDNDRLGLNTIVREIIDNAVDEYINYSDKNKPLCIRIDKGDIVCVRDHGRGISPYASKKVKGAIEERLAFTLIGAGGKFRENREQNGNRFSGGLNGTGSVGTNAMSEYFHVVIYKDGYVFEDHYVEGVPITPTSNGQLPKKKQIQPETGTEITFKPSKKYMRTTKIDVDYLQHYLQQVAYLNPGLQIQFENARDDEDIVIYHSKEGLLDYMKALAVDDDNRPINYLVKPFLIQGKDEVSVMNQINHMEVCIAVAFGKGDGFGTRAFTNGIENTAGGTHLQGFYQGLLQLLRHYYDEFQSEFNATYRTQLELIRKVNNLSSTSEVFKLVKARNISRKTYVIIDFKHDDPILKPQTKEELASPEAKGVVANIFYDKAMLYLDKNIPAVHELIGHLIKELYEKAKMENTNINLTKSELKQAVSTKLSAARSNDPSKKEIFVVEGDSAAGTLKENRDSNYQAVLPLRGKILNAKKAILAKLMANAEVATFFTTIGAGLGSHYDDTKRQYERIIIATDQDVDGLHIRVLLIVLIMEYMPELIERGHVYYLDTPLYVNVMKGKKDDVYIYTEEEQVSFVTQYNTKIEEVQRKKGLGELSTEQVISTILTPETRHLTQLTIADVDALSDIIEQLMGKDVQGRKHLFLGQ